ncbi:MAG: hypothetical protein WKF71_15715 [Pyrinomonadaceae bacterium]
MKQTVTKQSRISRSRNFSDGEWKALPQGVPYNEPLSVELSGPANGKSSLYKWDKNNFQPRIAFAWSPNFKSGFLGTLFGTNSESVIRGGFGII